jgi:ATP-dependent DNA helicase RecQ
MEYNFSRYFEKIERNIKIGDPITINKTIATQKGLSKVRWDLKVNEMPIGRLSKVPFNLNGANSIVGYSVSGIYRYTYQDTIEYDDRNSKDFKRNWCEMAREKGYIYLVEFSGYGKFKNP